MTYTNNDIWNTSHTHSISATPIYANLNVPSNMLIGVGNAVYAHPSTLTPKEPPMTTLDKMRAERREQRERERIQRIYDEYDQARFDEYADGTVLVFTWLPQPDKAYCYAALFTNEQWYVTGRESPNGLDTEDFVAWLIGKDIQPDDIEERTRAS